MADTPGVKISQLPAASNPGDSDVLAGVQSTTTKKFALSTLLAWIKAHITAADVGAVPTTRKVNNKALSADITLDASDVSAVPTSRKINNKALTSDITLTAADVNAASAPDTGTIALSASWSGNASPYTQLVTVSGATVTAHSKVDLQPTAAQIASLISDGVTGLVIENSNGTLTAYAVGAAPGASMTVQCTVTEVT